jgi:hypothetical protein
LQTGKVIGVKLVEIIRNFLWEVAKLTVLAEPHLVGANHLLPSQRTPTDVSGPTSPQMVGDLTPPLRSGPDIAANAKATACVLVSPPLISEVSPPPVCSERYLAGFSTMLMPVVLFKAFVAIVNARCKHVS